MRIRLIGPGDMGTWCRMRRALWPDAAERDLIREAEAYFDGASFLEAVFLGEAPSDEPLGMLELSLRSVVEGCEPSRWLMSRAGMSFPRRAAAASGASS